MTRFFVRHPVSTWMIFTAFLVLALYALPRIEVEAMPEVDLPRLSVSTRWAGASPKAVQRSITLPIEEAVRRVHGIENLVSESRAAHSVVTLELRRDINLDFARLEVNEQLGGVRRELPLGASQPTVVAIVPEKFQTENFFTFAIESSLGPNQLREEVDDWVVPQILAVDGVADARVIGGANSLVKILLDRQLLRTHGLTAEAVFNAVRTLDALSSVGVAHEDGLEKIVSLRDPLDFEKLENAVVARKGGVNLTLRDLGEVRADFEDPSNFVRSNGRNVVSVQVEKRSGGNSVAVSRALRAALPRIEADLPFDAKLRVDEDEGQKLEDKLRELLIRSLVILVVLFVLLAVSLRQVGLTAIVIGSILFALVICLSLFYFLRLSVNFITISGLTICFGMLLDNSILVLDSIHRRLEALQRADDEGLSHRAKFRVVMESVIQGTQEVYFPILATTLTTVVAFFSFIFLSGRLALYYVPLATSVGLAMLASIFVAFAWIPVVLRQTWAGRLVRRTPDGPNELRDEDQLDRIVHILPDLDEPLSWPRRLLHLNQRIWPVLLLAMGALMWFSWNTYDHKVIKGGIFQFRDPDQLILYMRLPDGTDVRVTSEIALKFEQALAPIPEGAHLTMNVFGNQAYMEIDFDEELLRGPTPLLFRSLLTEQADQIGASSIYINGFSDQPYIKGNFAGSALNSLIKITGYNSKILNQIAEDTLRKIQRDRRVRNARITSNNRFGRAQNEETVISLRRDVLADYGLSVADVIQQVQRLLGVDIPFQMLVDGDQERLQLSFAEAEHIEFSQVVDTVLDAPRGEKVLLGDLIELQTVPLSNSITRENQRYSMFVNWEYVGTDRMRRAYIQRILDSMDLPYGYSAEESRREFFTEEEESNLRLTVILALVFIFMVLAGLFESISLPLLVLSSVPMGLVGVVLAFWWSSSSFDSSARIGLVLLFGIVVNNAILLVSRFRHEAALTLKARLGGDPEADAGILAGTSKRLGGSDLRLLPATERNQLLRRAISRGTLIRLRSVLLTSSTTIVGLLPLLITVSRFPSTLWGIDLPFRVDWMDNDEAEIWENLALSSVGGLVSSTILLLWILPPLYYGFVWTGWKSRDLAERLRRLRVPTAPPTAGPPPRGFTPA